MKLRDSRLGIQCGEDWLAARLRHAPDVAGLALILDAGPPADAQAAERLVTALHDGGYASLELELLTEAERERDGDAAFNVPLLANRVLAAREWAAHQPDLAALPVLPVSRGTASGAAIRAAWKDPSGFAGVVCLGGRPDLAGATPLTTLEVPTRVIAHAHDAQLPIVQRAAQELSALHELRIIDTHTTDEAALVLEWLERWRDRVRGDDEDEDVARAD